MRILSMSGFVPEQICETIRFNGYTGERNLSHCCGYANDFISQVLNEERIDGAVFPRSCDSSRIIKSYLSDSKKFIHSIHVPARKDDMAIHFFANEIRRYKQSVEEYYKIELKEIPDRVQKINERNRQIADYYSNLEEYSYFDYLKFIHSRMNQDIAKETRKRFIKRKNKIKKRIFLVGSFLTNEEIVKILEENGLGIVGDNLPESGRIQNSIVSAKDGDWYRGIASAILSNRLSPTQNNFAELLQTDLQEIERVKADAVVFVTQKYCEPYDYLYSVYRKKLEIEGIPSLKLTLSDSEDNRKIDLYVEAFSDLI